MPTYEYECLNCGKITEKVFKVVDCQNTVKCGICGVLAKKIISKSAIQCDSANDVSWLKSAEQVIKPAHEKPWDSRKDYKECLQRNNLIPVG
jgi:putative FmdB family regulatory protein